jgi:hypothetical protein
MGRIAGSEFFESVNRYSRPAEMRFEEICVALVLVMVGADVQEYAPTSISEVIPDDPFLDTS